MLRFWFLAVSCFAASGALAPQRLSADWPQWRGHNRDDISTETGLLKSWPDGGPRRVWMFEDCGAGYGGPAVAAGRVFIMGVRDNREVLFALDAATGEEQWAAPIGEVYEEGHGDGPRSTPTVDGEFVYCLGAMGNLICASVATGEVAWSKSMEDLGGERPNWGYAESPLIYQNTILCTPGSDDGSMAALDKRTGDLVWQSKEITSNAHYSSIVPMVHEGHDEAVQLLPDQLVGFDPADGKLLWSVPWPRPVAAIPTPVVRDNYVYATSGYGTGCMLVKVGPDHETKTVYENKDMKNKQGGVILIGEHIFGHSEGAGWVCQEFLTGEQVWRDRDPMGMGAITFADGMLYCLSEDDGDVALVEPSTEGWVERSRFTIEPQSDERPDRGRIWVHPVVANGMLLLRDQNLVYCYDVRDRTLADAGGGQ